jgi:SOS-response transcriptional repressor LexA
MSAPEKEAKTQTPITVRPDEDWKPLLLALAAEIQWSPNEVCKEAAKAFVQMVNAPSLDVPWFVTMVRTLRDQKATKKHALRPFPGHEPRDKAEVSNNLYPSHRIPLYPRIAAGPPVEGDGQVVDWIDIPEGRFRYADFAVRVEGDSMVPTIQPGTVAIFVKAEEAPSGQIVAAYFPEKGEVCLKRYQNSHAHKLLSDNPKYAPLDARQAKIQGIYVGKL